MLRLLPRRLILVVVPGGTLTGLQRLARNLAGHLGWIAVGQGWTSPRQPGAILAVPPAENHRAWEDLLARARWLAGGSRPEWLNAVSADPAVSHDGTPSALNLFKRSPDAADLPPLGPPVVIVTPAGWAAIRRDPKRALERLSAFARRHPGAEAVQANDEHHLPMPVPLTSLITAVQALSTAVSSAMTARNDPRQRRGATVDAHAADNPDRGTGIPAKVEDPTKDAGWDAATKTTLPGGGHGSTHEGSASPEGGQTILPPLAPPNSEQWISQDAEQQDELDPSEESHLTNPRN